MTLLGRAAGRLRRQLSPTPEARAWKAACRAARRVPRRTPGRIQLAHYDIGYADLLTLCPQWHDLFVRRTLDSQLSTTEPVIFDCGANIGLASLFFKSRYPAARIRAFEADPALAQLAAGNLQRNGAGDVDLRAAAVWTREGTVSFLAEGSDSGAVASVAAATLSGGTRDVPCVRLRDEIARESAVDLLKVDIEGAEADVLDDCAPVLDRVGALVVEVHETNAAARRLPRVLSTLERAGLLWSLDELVRLPWMTPADAPSSPFARGAESWAVLVRAWRPDHARG